MSTLEENQTFYIQWETPYGEVKTDAIFEAEYVENYVYYKTNAVSYGFEGDGNHAKKEVGSPIASLPMDTAYIQIVQFNGDAVEAFDKAMSIFTQEYSPL